MCTVLFQTDLPPGTYCDIISGDVSKGQCTGIKVTVNAEGLAHVTSLISSDKGEGLLAIHVEVSMPINVRLALYM